MSFELQPTLIGELVDLHPLLINDWNDLFTAASDPLIWEQHPERDRYKENVFRMFFKEALECGGAFVVIDRRDRQVIGSTRFHGYDPRKSEVEIGWTFLARKYWGGRYNREMKRLMLDHAFRFVDTVIFLIGEHNVRSQKAIEKIGASRDGFVEKLDRNGRPRRNLRYGLTSESWLRAETTKQTRPVA